MSSITKVPSEEELENVMKKNLEEELDEFVKATDNLGLLIKKIQEKKMFPDNSLMTEVKPLGQFEPHMLSLSFETIALQKGKTDKERKEITYEKLRQDLNKEQLNELYKILWELGFYTAASLLKPWNPLKKPIEVTKNTRTSRDGSTEYEVNSVPKGQMLLINLLKDRPGSKNDVNNLEKLWSSLGYSVQTHSQESFLKQELEKLVTDFQVSTKSRAGDSVVVIIMGHGKQNEFHMKEVDVAMADGSYVNTEWVVQQFSTGFEGKPKMFFFQMCRGDEFDKVIIRKCDETCERESKPSVQENRIVMTDDVSETHLSEDHNYKNGQIDMKDTLVVFPSCPGNVSIRDPERGSWFVQQMCQTFMQEAHEKHLEEMLKSMDEALSSLYHLDCGSQVLNTENRQFDKNLYFYPE